MLKNVLEACGLAPTVTDANLAQAQMLLAQTIGGVRVLVPASQAAAARQAIAEFRAGAFELDDGDKAPAPTTRPLAAAVFSPDRATVWSFALTPVFGASLQLANSLAAGDRGAQRRDAAWLAAMAVLTVMAVFVAHRLNPGLFVVFRASIATAMPRCSGTSCPCSSEASNWSMRTVTPMPSGRWSSRRWGLSASPCWWAGRWGNERQRPVSSRRSMPEPSRGPVDSDSAPGG
ncbi:hypothetical protein [Ideonella sp. YS5]|uniref:hypothetical protein n=1 Tax=Ideonella sp. YS5 TaxID=3453714 RepID=UPI003EEE9EFA